MCPCPRLQANSTTAAARGSKRQATVAGPGYALAGLLQRDEEKRMAEMDAWSVCGVTDVQNQIQVAA